MKKDQIHVFEGIKQFLSEKLSLCYFNPDPAVQMVLMTDASPVGLGGVLIQVLKSCPQIICYISRSLSVIEKHYSQTEKEALAIVWACERLYVYL